ncbi:hypothetical protein [Blastomonas sp.]|uniref:hypothetical protein n=1 Tax=Blastomonas sp. TaxID=1909299 RepID=UPI00391C442C
MKPDIPVAASDLAERLRTEIVPGLSGFRANNVAMTAQMLDMIGERWDDAAAVLFEENAALRVLLERGAAYRTSAGTVAASDTDLRISALTRANTQLRSALIALQTMVEQHDDADARALNSAIWSELRRSVDRRRVKSANF